MGKENIYGGFLGIGKYKSKIKGRATKCYQTWFNLILRCYDEKHHDKYSSYKDCEVCPEWLNYQNFAQWYEENYVEGFHLDKDFLFKNNKTYCEDRCCFLPRKINALFRNVSGNKDNLPEGVTKLNKTFKARLSKYNKRIHLGCFASSEEAHKAYLKGKKEYLKELANKYKKELKPEIYKRLITHEF